MVGAELGDGGVIKMLLRGDHSESDVLDQPPFDPAADRSPTQ